MHDRTPALGAHAVSEEFSEAHVRHMALLARTVTLVVVVAAVLLYALTGLSALILLPMAIVGAIGFRRWFHADSRDQRVHWVGLMRVYTILLTVWLW